MPLPRKLGFWLMLVILLALGPLAVRSGQSLMVALAIRKGNATALRGLLRDGGDVNVRNGNGMTALMVAAQAGDVRFVRELISRGAEVNAQDKDYNTALYLAAASGRLEVVRELLKVNASLLGRVPFYVSYCTDTPRRAAKLAGHLKVVQLVAGAERQTRRLLTETQCERSLHGVGPPDPSRLSRWKSYLEQGADPNWGNVNGNSVAVLARAGDLEGLQLLFDHHGDPKFGISPETSLMSIAAIGGTPAMLDLLLHKGLAVNMDSRFGPLYSAVDWGRLDNVRF